MAELRLLLTHALQDMRGGTRHLRLLFICLFLGVAVMSCIGSMIWGLRAGIDRDAKSLLGGDIEIRQIYEPIPDLAASYLMFNSDGVSRIMTMRAMATNEALQLRTLIEIKAVDSHYPLYGKLEIYPEKSRSKIYESLYVAAVDMSLMESLNLKLGDDFKVGDATFQVHAIIDSEPDRGMNSLSLGPRVMVSADALKTTNLFTFGTMVNYHYRVKLPENTDLSAWKQKLAETFPDARWNMRDLHDSAPGLVNLIERLALFFALSGITTLAVAGIGISNAAGIYIWVKQPIIATMKCLGASQRYIRHLYFLQLLLVGLVATVLGLIFGVIAEILLFHFFGHLLPIQGVVGVHPIPLLLSAGLGLFTLLLFGLAPIRRLDSVKPATLFRGYADILPTPPIRELPRSTLATYALLIAGMVLLAIGFTQTVRIPLYFAGGLAGSMILLYVLSGLIRNLALKRAHSGKYRLSLSMALANLARPGAATTSILVALGIGMTLIISLALVGSNLREQLEEGLPEKAPAFFLIDIQPSELNSLLSDMRTLPQNREMSYLPIVRGGIVRLNGVPVNQLNVAERARWAVRGDRGLTWAAEAPANTNLVEGKWWPKDYNGPPLVSFDARLARDMGLKIGDTITIAALDKEITATIHNLRDIQWGSLEMNFAMILSPGALDGLPATYIATIHVPPSGEKIVRSMLDKNHPQVAVVHVREALGRISEMLARISNAVLAVSAVTILCGVVVMASAINAAMQKRVFDTVMLKVLGVQREQIMNIYLAEFGMIATAAALVAAVLGSLAAWGVMQLMIFSHFALKPWVIFPMLALSLLVSVLVGLGGMRLALNVRPLALLRNE